jgi:hypothetical protein
LRAIARPRLRFRNQAGNSPVVRAAWITGRQAARQAARRPSPLTEHNLINEYVLRRSARPAPGRRTTGIGSAMSRDGSAASAGLVVSATSASLIASVTNTGLVASARTTGFVAAMLCNAAAVPVPGLR